MSQLNFDARSVEPQVSLEALPAGWYTAQIIRSEQKPTSNKDGSFLELEMEVFEPAQFKGRKIFDRLNLQNKNPTAQEIAYRTLSSICHATGIIQVQDSTQLHGIPMEVRLTVNVDESGRYDPSNDVRAYRALNGGTGGGQQMGGQLSNQPPGFGQPAPQQQPAQQMQQPAQQQPPAQQWQQPPAQEQPQQQWQQPPAQQQPPQQQPAPEQATQQQPWQQPAQQQAPAQQEQAPVQNQPWNQPPPAADQQVASGAPVGGPAPSANAQPGTPPWGQQPAQ